MKFTFIYLISTIECMYIVHSFAIGAVESLPTYSCSLHIWEIDWTFKSLVRDTNLLDFLICHHC